MESLYQQLVNLLHDYLKDADDFDCIMSIAALCEELQQSQDQEICKMAKYIIYIVEESGLEPDLPDKLPAILANVFARIAPRMFYYYVFDWSLIWQY